MSKTSFYSGNGVTPVQSNAIEDSLAAAKASEDAAALSEVAAAASAAGVAADTAEAAASELAAAASASSAASSAATSTTQANIATSNANNAAASGSTATTKASEAAASAAAALVSKNAASASQSAAAASATGIETARVAAVAARAAAETAETNAETAETNAETAETNAETAETNAQAAQAAAGTAKVNAETAETNAAASAGTATTQAGISTTKAGEASTSASNAASSASSAQASKDAALAALDSFDDRYLGQKASDPTVDNDGNALVSGSLYFNTTDDAMMVYEGSTWVAAYASLSGAMLSANNLSDLGDAGTSRTNLGLAISTNVQAYSAVLAATTAAFTTAEETKLAGVEAGAQANVPTNLGSGASATDVVIVSSSGSNTTIIAATSSDAGVMVAADKVKLDGISDLAAIAATKSDTAVDVFVYDTSKDSDGGAWRKRTQNTSWYNEALNTATRGSRKEFPAVAVIVAEAQQVTIYDGDDPDMPMWMVFETNTSDMLASGILSLTMLNGVLAVTRNTPLHVISFVSDGHTSYSPTSRNSYLGAIGQRNSGLGFSANLGTPYVVANVGNDVAMTVLPNAPIDAATGLPVPTIAVATDGGISVIKDDGTVANMQRGSNETGTVAFDDNYDLVFSWGTSANAHRHITKLSAPWNTFNNSTTFTNNYLYSSAAGGGTSGVAKVGNSGRHFGIDYDPTGGGNIDDRLLTIVSSNNQVDLSNFITSDYSTGYMVGDIKLATLSDTDDTNVTGAELVTNGTFDSDTNWTKETGWSIGSGVATASSAGHGRGLVQTGASFVGGVTYLVTFTVSNYTAGSLTLYAPRTPTFSRPFLGAAGANGTYAFTYTPTVSSSDIRFEASGTTSLSIDNISIRKAEQDRSVNGNGIQVFGTVTKNPVATGADLVAYSGFSGSNYLQQPYNAGLDFGTGNFNVTLWLKSSTDGVGCAFHRGSGSSGTWGAGIIQIEKNTSNFSLNVSANGFSAVSTLAVDETLVRNGNWNCVNAGRLNGKLFMYINGLRVGSLTTSSTENLTNTAAKLWIGERPNASRPWDGDIALVRVSATVPSPEQITKIFNDEKHLFQAGAKATLHGTSDSVTALAYDDTTDLLHVGTSAGRSVFQGLRRVENTTNAVGAAISASNGLVAED